MFTVAAYGYMPLYRSLYHNLQHKQKEDLELKGIALGPVLPVKSLSPMQNLH